MEASSGKNQVFVHGDCQQIGDVLQRPGILTILQTLDSAVAEKENPAVFAGRYIHKHGFVFQQRVGFSEDLPATDVTDDRTIASGVIALNCHTPFKNKSHPFRD